PLIVYFDGLCEPINPGGVATYGYVVHEGGRRLKEGRDFLAEGRGASNNLAEYAGLVAALEWLLANGYREQEVEGEGRFEASNQPDRWHLASQRRFLHSEV